MQRIAGEYKGLQGITRVYKGFIGIIMAWFKDYMVAYHELGEKI